MPQRCLQIGFPLDLRLTLGGLRHGYHDPTIRITATDAVRATRTPDGAATLHLSLSRDRLEARGWGPGAEWLLERVPALIGIHDEPSALSTTHPLLRDLQKRFRGLRIGRSDAVMEALVPAVIGQKVVEAEARRSYHKLVRAWGEPAPGPHELLLLPAPEVLAAQPYWTFHPFGIERRRAETIRRAAARARRLEETTLVPIDEAYRRLTSVAGIGPWTAALVGASAYGDPDAVPVGDYHIPHLVSWALAGEARGSDARMLELLEPYRGQRGRVVRLLALSGNWAPRFAPGRRLRSIADA